jgi:hypothetical protein
MPSTRSAKFSDVFSNDTYICELILFLHIGKGISRGSRSTRRHRQRSELGRSTEVRILGDVSKGNFKAFPERFSLRKEDLRATRFK